MEIGGFKLDFNDIQRQWTEWQTNQPPAMQAVIAGLSSATSGAFIGYLLGSMAPPDLGPQAQQNPALAAQMKALQGGGPWAQARNLAVLTGVNAAMSTAIKNARNGKEDVYNA